MDQPVYQSYQDLDFLLLDSIVSGLPLGGQCPGNLMATPVSSEPYGDWLHQETLLPFFRRETTFVTSCLLLEQILSL